LRQTIAERTGFLVRCLSGPITTALPSGITLELVDELRTDDKPRAPPSRYGTAPPTAGKRDFHISEAGTFACAVCRCRGEGAGAWVTYRGAGALRARALGPAASRGNGKNGGAAPHRSPRIWKRSAPVPAGAFCHATSTTALERLTPPIPEIAADTGSRAPRSAPRRLHAHGNRLGKGSGCRAAGPLAGIG